jgi:succinate dehydrogenase / fumarate reductase cytochrome b subunit
MWHVFHMHGWIHAEPVRERVVELGGAKFAPYNASSSAGLALQSVVVAVLYAIGVLACVYHLANGIWTMGITWGVWTTPHAQSWALKLCSAFGLILAIVGLSALFGLRDVGHGPALEEAIAVENKMYEHKVEAGEIQPNEHKRSTPHEPDDNRVAQSNNE